MPVAAAQELDGQRRDLKAGPVVAIVPLVDAGTGRVVAAVLIGRGLELPRRIVRNGTESIEEQLRVLLARRGAWGREAPPCRHLPPLGSK